MLLLLVIWELTGVKFAAIIAVAGGCGSKIGIALKGAAAADGGTAAVSKTGEGVDVGGGITSPVPSSCCISSLP